MRHPTPPLRLALLLAIAAASTATAAPASVPQVFAPGAISGPEDDACAAFTPDGQTVLFWRSTDTWSSIVESHQVHGRWSTPKTASFSGQWRDLDPTMSPDGRFLLFVSNRPVVPGGKALDGVTREGKVNPGSGMNLWRVDRQGSGWGTPVRLPSIINTSPMTFAPSVAADGSVYYIGRDLAEGALHLLRSSFRQGKYQPPERVNLGGANAVIRDPAIAPDQSFIVVSTRPADSKAPLRLAIAFRSGDRWGALTDLGDAINGTGPAMGSQLGPERRSVYFNSGRPDASAPPGASWNKGSDNIWFASLAPWLDARTGTLRP